MAVAPAESPPFIMRSHSEPVLKDWFHVTCEGTEGHHQAWGLQCTLGNQADSILTDEHTALVLSSCTSSWRMPPVFPPFLPSTYPAEPQPCPLAS